MNDPVPVRRAAIGCLTIAVLVGALLLLVRPAIFTLAPPRDDTAVLVATGTELGSAPIRRDVILTRAYGWAGEVDAGDGRSQVTILVTPTALGGASAVNAASPARRECAVELAEDRLRDCDGRTWTFDGLPLATGDPVLERFPAAIEGGSVVVDMSRTLED